MSVVAPGRRAPGQLAVLGPLGALLVLYLLVPVGAFLVRLATTPVAQLRVPGLGDALATSLETASASTVVIGVLGVPLAFLLSRSRLRSSTVLGFLVQLPLALPPLVSGILLIYVVGPYTPLGNLFGDQLTDTPIGIMIAQVFVAAPFCIVAARSAFGGVDPALDDVAATLGHGSLGRFWHVWLRGAAAGIAAGLLLAWLRAFGEFGATVLLAYHPYSLPVFTYVQFGSTGLPSTMAPVAAALLAPFCMLAIASLLPRLRAPGRRAGLPAARPPATAGGPAIRFDLDAHLGSFRLRAAMELPQRRLAILGPSGAGKTFTLRLLAGLERGVRADLWLDERVIGALPAERRRVGYVPQDASLLPGLPVWRQVTFGVDADPALAAHWLAVLGLAGLEDRYPEQLSGGQRRRVAIARALAIAPALLLLDEPFTGLDAPVRNELRRELRLLQREANLSTVLVTHDPDEAAMLADTVLVLIEGEVAQAGPQPEVFGQPASPLVARLLGIQNVWTGRAREGRRVGAGPLLVRHAGPQLAPGTPVSWCIRPERVHVGAPSGIEAQVLDRIDLGTLLELELLVAGELRCIARVAAQEAPGVGERTFVAFPPEAIVVWEQLPEPPAG